MSSQVVAWVEVVVRCPACGVSKVFDIQVEPRLLRYYCKNEECTDQFKVLAWDSRYCVVVGPPEYLATNAVAKRDVEDYLAGLKEFYPEAFTTIKGVKELTEAEIWENYWLMKWDRRILMLNGGGVR